LLNVHLRQKWAPGRYHFGNVPDAVANEIALQTKPGTVTV
jgi:hypothetical protein